MATPSWPLPNAKFLMSGGYQETMQMTVIRTEMETGPAKMRQRFTKNVQPIKGKLAPINQTDYSTLYGFFNGTCAGGALSFTWDMTNPRLVMLYPALVIDVPNGIVRLTLRFTKPPVATLVTGFNVAANIQSLLSVDLELEVMP